MKATLLRKIWIMLGSLWYIIGICLKTIIYCYLKKNKKLDQIIHQDSYKLLSLAKPKIKIYGEENLILDPNKKYMIICNHSSHYDIPLTFLTFKGMPVKMVAKTELFKVPILGAAMRSFRTVEIDRSNLKTAIKNLENAKQLLSEGIIIWVAAEGTRSAKQKNKPFKKGGLLTAIEAKANIIPMYIDGAENMLPAKTWDFYLHQPVNIHLTPHIDCSKYTTDNVNQLITDIKQAWSVSIEKNNHYE